MDIHPPSSRNAACPCGSGRRYKDCHGSLAAAATPEVPRPAPPQPLLDEALAAHRAGRFEEAEAGYRQALALAPDDFNGLHMLGVLLYQTGRHADAVALLARASDLHPVDPAAHNNLGLALMGALRATEALLHFDAALRLRPDFVEARANRGAALRTVGRRNDAIDDLRQAAALRPESTDIEGQLAGALFDAGHHEEAAGIFARHAGRATPLEWALGNLLFARLAACAWDGMEALTERIEAAVRAGERAILPFPSLLAFDDPALLRDVARIFTSTVAARPVATTPVVTWGAPERMRVAYFSPDLHEHPTARLTAGMFEAHDRSRFEVTAFSFGADPPTPLRRRIVAAFEHFVDVRGLDDRAVVALARDRGVHVAVDLAGHTLGSRPGIFAGRAAPVQVSFLGFPGTQGAPWLDYLIADRHVVPPGDERHYDEAVVRLPETYFPTDRELAIASSTPTREEAGLPADGFVFCCFNNAFKILPATFDPWMRILRAVDGSVLWLLKDQDRTAANLRREAARRGVDPGRLRFAVRVPTADHLARHRLADLMLDTLPYNAHTTTVDALWAGLPVLTRSGRSFAARAAGSLLNAAGLPELVVPDDAAFEATAVELARSPARLHALRARLRDPRSLPLFQTGRFTRALEDAYLAMWANHSAGVRGRVIEVAAR